MKRVLVANRGEIAIRIFRTCTEMGISTIALYSYEDRYSLHRYKADESYQIGADGESVKPYLDADAIIALAKRVGADAIHPGYGFLSENAEFAKKCEDENIIFVGPKSTVISKLGNKIDAKKIAKENHIPIIDGASVDTLDSAKKVCNTLKYPVMLKAASGGGGRGMRVLQNESDLIAQFQSAKNEAKNAFGDDHVFIEKYIANPKHIEVQILGDSHGQLVHLFERDCSVQRRFQKVIEYAPSFGLETETIQKLYDFALKITRSVQYSNAGTVEFLVEGSEIYFIEVNPRIQVEHTVTEMITGIDIVKCQLLIAEGYALNSPEIDLAQERIQKNGFAIQCRITTENPADNFKPSYGKILHYRTGSGFGIRLDDGNIYNGAIVSPFFDSMLVKVSTWGKNLVEATDRMHRALVEFRVRGVETNVLFLENVMRHSVFRSGKSTVHFITNHNELFTLSVRLDRGTKMLAYIAEVSVNGNPDVKKIDPTHTFFTPKVPNADHLRFKDGSKQRLEGLGAEKFAKWLQNEQKVQITDTTFRDAHQSLLATRVRSYDILQVAESFAKHHPDIFSIEMWGGATFDVSYRFLNEDPWKRLQAIRKAMPNMLTQMLIRGSNAVGYTAYPDNVIIHFIEKAAKEGMDIFRIFDSLNWFEGMKLSIETVRNNTNSIAEACICYTGDVLNTTNKKYNLDYYVNLAQNLKSAGTHILGIKDMAGLLKPYAAEVLISELKSKVDLPIHLHTHDTSSIQSTTYLKAIESGVDVIDCALGGLSGLTSQPNMNAMIEMLRHTKHELDFDMKSLNQFSAYWETVRDYYYPFESGLKAGTADVYYHEIPGGQYSNLKPQAISLGLGDRMEEIKEMYHDVNELFGDIVKVTPSSKVVGDLALYLVSNGLTVADIFSQGDQFPFPESVVGFFMGKLGQPTGGFPEELQKLVLKGKKPFTDQPGKHLAPVDLEKGFADFQTTFGQTKTDLDYISYLLYPKVYQDYHNFQETYGDVSTLPSPLFFYGMKKDQEISVEIARGKTLIIKLISISNPNKLGKRHVFFEMNGQFRQVTIDDKTLAVEKIENKKASSENENEIGFCTFCNLG
jgi:pyruvate carboxylase